MAKDFMMLAKDFNPDKVSFPAQFTEKLDGVASFFVWRNGTVQGISRQNKQILSVTHIEEWLQDRLPRSCRVIGELTVDGVPDFKDAGGIIRRDDVDTRIVLNVYDYLDEGLILSARHTFAQRMTMMVEALKLTSNESKPVRLIAAGTAKNQEEGRDLISSIYKQNPKAEGVMIRAWHGEHSLYKFGRSWGLMRLKPQPTIDLPILGFEEAVSKDKVPMGMVGKVIARYKKQDIGVGPGKLTHEERKYIWENQAEFLGLIAEIKYMQDDSYSALRQPTFQQWRRDLSNTSTSLVQ